MNEVNQRVDITKQIKGPLVHYERESSEVCG